MRHESTYRAAKRKRVKAWAKNDGAKFIAVWREQEVPNGTMGYRPDRVTGKTYAANGKRECARRVQQAAQRSN